MNDIKLDNAHIMFGDAMKRLKELPDNSVDSIVTDPPYGLSDNKFVAETIIKWVNGERDFTPDGKGFMGKAWDSFVPPPAIWDECMRVLKPGGHLLAFFGSRTQDIGALSIRLAGFEIRDSIAWVYGSGFPKSMNIGKAIDKAAGVERKVIGTKIASPKGISAAEGRTDTAAGSYGGEAKEINITAPATDAAKQWDSWGTAMKPAVEPIVVARKPLSESTVANNVLKWGTGGLNIDASRIGTELIPAQKSGKTSRAYQSEETTTAGGMSGGATGRFPANIILGHTEDCVDTGEVITDNITLNGEGNDKLFHGNFNGGQDQTFKQASTPIYECVDGCPVKELDKQTSGKLSQEHWSKTTTKGYGEFGNGESSYQGVGEKADDAKLGASKFFYVAKASKKDRNEGLDGLPLGKIYPQNNSNERKELNTTAINRVQNFHPTVKPTKLMEYLIKLVTPEGGTVLDPFTGSGSTGKAALLNGFKFIGCELTDEYLPIIEGRLTFAANKYAEEQQLKAETLFELEDN